MYFELLKQNFDSAEYIFVRRASEQSGRQVFQFIMVIVLKVYAKHYKEDPAYIDA